MSARSFWLDERILPLYVATASLLMLLVRELWTSKPVKTLRRIEMDKKTEPLVCFLDRKGGITIALFKITRLASILVLLCISAVTAIKQLRLWDLALVVALVCSSLF